jgi:hypothetical protein
LNRSCGSAQERAAMLESDACRAVRVAAAELAAATGETLATGGLSGSVVLR